MGINYVLRRLHFLNTTLQYDVLDCLNTAGPQFDNSCPTSRAVSNHVGLGSRCCVCHKTQIDQLPFMLTNLRSREVTIRALPGWIQTHCFFRATLSTRRTRASECSTTGNRISTTTTRVNPMPFLLAFSCFLYNIQPMDHNARKTRPLCRAIAFRVSQHRTLEGRCSVFTLCPR